MTDDHASHAISCYGSKINETPNLDRIAKNGMRFDNCFCTNSICAPSRATILTGTYNNINGVTTLGINMDNRQITFPKLLQANGYQTAIFGKWHLGEGKEHEPTGFDHWDVLPGQGDYHNPDMIKNGIRENNTGYSTDLISDKTIDWLKERDKKRPFMVMCHHKAPHRPWEPDEKHMHMYEDVDIPEPETLNDDYSNRAKAAEAAEMRVSRDLTERDLKGPVPSHLSEEEANKWKYQKYIKDYLRCVASVDDNVGNLLDYVEESDLKENTIIVYTSDQGFYLGDHGWYDKRFMYEESLRMPFLIQYPKEIPGGTVNKNMILNVDFAQTFLDYAGIEIPERMQGNSIKPLLNCEVPEDWQTSMYYRYWQHKSDHNVYAHYGVRTQTHKLIYYYADGMDIPGTTGDKETPEWELFDLQLDPLELNNVYSNPDYELIIEDLKKELNRLQKKVKDEPYLEVSH